MELTLRDLLSLQRRLQADDLLKSNELTARFGLTLSSADIEQMLERRAYALRETGRVELGQGIYAKLIEAFCDSPYLMQQNYADTLGELVDIFYHYKGEARERLSDDELIGYMKEQFDGPCQGSTDYLAGTTLEALCRDIRNGEDE